jgi:hypothetical protein
VHGGLRAEFLMGQIAHRDDQIVVLLDLADMAGPQPGQRQPVAAGGRDRAGSIAGPGWVPAETAGMLLARRHSAAARCERAEFALHTNSTRRAVRGGAASRSRAPGISRR